MNFYFYQMKKITFFILYSFVFVLCISCISETTDLNQLTFKGQLEVLFPEANIDSLESKDHFVERYRLTLQQPLDHENLEAGTFEHQIYISHAGYEQPNLLITTGYNARNSTYELSKAFKMNQILVEYRFYGKSRPDSIQWKYLTNDAALDDYHAITSKLKKIYKGKWMSTGISKGGETVMMYKTKYPNDMDVGVPYVAPLINTQEDIRTQNHINSIGNKACREKIIVFQREVLSRRATILPKLKDFAASKNYTFNEVSLEETLEYVVLEYPFSFWQWGGKCNEIPESSATDEDIVKYLNSIVGYYIYSDAGYDVYLTSFYQHMKEIGYYGYDFTPVSDLLQVVKYTSNMRFAPKNVDLTYNPEYIKNVRKYIETNGHQLIYIYGGNDPWYACAPSPNKNVAALKMVLKGGSHATRIKHFSQSDQDKIYQQLQEWLGGATLYLDRNE